MKFPLQVDITSDEARRLEALRQEFLATMGALTPKQQIARASVIAGGIRKADPYTRALAKQVADIDRLNREAAEAQAEIDFIDSTRRRTGLDPAPAMVARKVKLEEHVAELRARQIGITETDFTRAQQKAVLAFREEAATHERNERLAEAIARQTAEAEQADIEARAATVVRGKRIGAGKPSKAGEAQ